MIILDEMTFYATLGACFIPTIILAGILLIASPVLFPYLKAIFTGYMLIEIDKTNTLRHIACKFKRGVVEFEKEGAMYLKNGLHGSYNIGKVRCDLVMNRVGIMAETDRVLAMSTMDEIGISSYADLCALATAAAMAKTNNPEIQAAIPYDLAEILREHPDIDFEVVCAPLAHYKISKLVEWVDRPPEEVPAILAQMKTRIANNYANAAGKTGTSGSDLMLYGIVAFILVIAAVFALTALKVI